MQPVSSVRIIVPVDIDNWTDFEDSGFRLFYLLFSSHQTPVPSCLSCLKGAGCNSQELLADRRLHQVLFQEIQNTTHRSERASKVVFVAAM